MKYSHIAITGVLAAGFSLGACNQPAEGGGVGVPAGTELSILYTSNNNGEIEPCG